MTFSLIPGIKGLTFIEEWFYLDSRFVENTVIFRNISELLVL